MFHLLTKLQNLLSVWCIYPHGAEPQPSFKINRFWQIRDKNEYKTEAFTRTLQEEARHPGKRVVLACGDSQFVEDMRQVTTATSTTERLIEFVESEWKPLRLGESLRCRRDTLIEAVTSINPV
jgi:hypothetical protein